MAISKFDQAINHDRKWDLRWLNVAKEVASWSKDPSTKVGAVIVDARNKIVSTGYNGFPEGVDDSDERYNNREEKYKFIVHAEENAILHAGHDARGSTIYIYPGFRAPCICHKCAQAAIQTGIRKVVGLIRPGDETLAERWKDSLDTAYIMLNEAKIFVKQYKE